MEILLNLKDYLDSIRKKLILKNYYSKKLKDGKNLGASLLDRILISIFVGVFLIITTFKLTKNLGLSLVLSTVLMTIYLFLLITIGLKRRAKKMIKINEDLSKEETIRRFEKLNNREYLLFIQEILEKYYKTQLMPGDEYIDFVGKINGKDYGIKCFKSSLENIIVKKDIENYYESMKTQGLDNGIVITNGHFHEELKEKFDYIFIDFNYLKEILREIDEYPTTEEIHQLILTDYKTQRKAIKEDFQNNKRQKVHRFGALGIILYLISSYTDYALYYKISGVLLIFVSFILGFKKLIEFLKTSGENSRVED